MVIIPASTTLAPPKFAARLAFTLHEEGGYVDDPEDTGGITDFGITLCNWRAFMGDPEADGNDLRKLTPGQKSAFYGAMYWNPVRGDDLPPALDLMTFDHGVNAGTARSAMLLQQALGVPQDGHIGSQTLAVAHRAVRSVVLDTLAHLQETFYRTRPAFGHFGAGWLARLGRRTRTARALLLSNSGV